MESANRDNSATAMVTGELVLLNTRQAGTRQPLVTPTTFVGREQGCDMRLNVDGIDKLHCLFINGHDGIRIRDLKSTSGTFVNGVRTEHLLLQNGDVLEGGPFQYRVELAANASVDGDPARDGLRIQVAAVAAQQAALEEEEIRLQKRKADLEQQQEQLAAHLAAKQQQLEDWSERTRVEQEALQADKLEYATTIAASDAAIALGKEQCAQDQQKLASERQRVDQMYQRLRQRWQKRWALEKEEHHQLLDKFETDRRGLEQGLAAFDEREAAFSQELVRFNTERELFTRQLHDERGELKKDQERWHKRRSLEMSAMELRHRELDETQLKLVHARQLLVQEKETWDRQQSTLEKELHGINNRIVNQRFRLREQEEELARLDALSQEKLKSMSPEVKPTTDAAADSIADDAATTTWDPRITELAQLASDLTDQRTAIIEQYERLAKSINRGMKNARAARDLTPWPSVVARSKISPPGNRKRSPRSNRGSRQAEVECVRRNRHLPGPDETRSKRWRKSTRREMLALRHKEAPSKSNWQLANIRIAGTPGTRRTQPMANKPSCPAREQPTNVERSELFARRQQLAEERCVLAEKSLRLSSIGRRSQRAKDPEASASNDAVAG